jgi:hypothetical protein
VELLEDLVELVVLEEELLTITAEEEDELKELVTIAEELVEVVELEGLDLTEKASYAPTPTTAITIIATTAIANGAIPLVLCCIEGLLAA